jgi:hypothetical protein
MIFTAAVTLFYIKFCDKQQHGADRRIDVPFAKPVY